MKYSFSILICTLFLFGCNGKKAVDQYTEQNILVIGNSDEPKSLDLQDVSGVIESNILRSIFEGLCLEHPSKDGVSLPGAAATWQSNDDFTRWVFNLQPEGKWSDGNSVTSADFEYAYHRILHPKFAAEYAGMLYYIKGAEDYNKDKRSKILAEHLENLTWDEIKDINLSGEPTQNYKNELSAEVYSSLSKNQQLEVLQSIGLDSMNKEQLESVKNGHHNFRFPDTLNPATKQILLDSLIEYADKDLWSIAKVGIETPDPLTLIINLRGPIPFLPDITKHYTWYPVPKHLIEEKGSLTDSSKQDWTAPGVMVGNGAFKLAKWKFNDYIEVDRNPYYWDYKTVQLNGIRFLPVGNQYTEARMFHAGEMHKTEKIAPEMIEYSQKHIPKSVRLETYLGCHFLRLNVTDETLKHIEIRKAISFAIDPQGIIDTLLKGGETRATGIVPKMGDYLPPNHTRFDPVEAKKWLAAFKEKTGKDPKKITINFLTTTQGASKSFAEAIQDQLKNNLELDVSIEQAEWGTYLNRMIKLDYGLCSGGWIGDYPDPTTFLDMWKTGDGSNRTGWGSQHYEDLLAKAEREKDPKKRIELLQEAELIFLSDYAIVPIYWHTSKYLLHSSVQNWHPLLMNNNPFKFISLKQHN
jgi:oligopeptide transport system substrate-binding protein